MTGERKVLHEQDPMESNHLRRAGTVNKLTAKAILGKIKSGEMHYDDDGNPVHTPNPDLAAYHQAQKKH